MTAWELFVIIAAGVGVGMLGAVGVQIAVLEVVKYWRRSRALKRFRIQLLALGAENTCPVCRQALNKHGAILVGGSPMAQCPGAPQAMPAWMPMFNQSRPGRN